MAEQAIATADKIKALEARLNAKLAERKLSFVSTDSEIDEIFAISMDELSKLTSQKLSEYAFIISRYGVYLGLELNKEKSARNWAKKSLDYIVLPVMSNYRVPQSYMSNDEVKMKAILDNDVAQKFYTYIAEKEKDIDLLSDLAFDIRKMSESLTEISKSKRFNHA